MLSIPRLVPALAVACLAACTPGRDRNEPGCDATDATALTRCVEPARYEADLKTLAAQPRPPGSAGWQAAQDHCFARLQEAGFQVERRPYAAGVNVVGVRPGATKPAEHVLLSAHYDSTSDCAGADDNASGVAGVLEAARALARGRYQRTLVVACWDQEERLYVSGGSVAYANGAKEQGDQIAVSLVFEMIGFKSDAPDSQDLPFGFDLIFPEQTGQVAANGYKGDFATVVADETAALTAEAFVRHAAPAALPAVNLTLTAAQKNNNLFADLRRSDHASFWAKDYPAIMVTDTANFRNTHYHCTGGPDAVADLNTQFASGIVRATVGSLAEALQLH